ncbi:uncharacterized protein EI97DRAFT_272530 [Westerdykella ornata]|uniref:Uncharacterized protein n=1 Tax=Westerdykella ornata TaxID=318751 RepID=A0A6A6JMN9_WESOR|nr:uncharacterized protein EI97DRAFT_272530 [Westerdykella ornata]KAF2277762.1 hypothetical protein EI97DRAFT_272530 [Westerdykella ornata]
MSNSVDPALAVLQHSTTGRVGYKVSAPEGAVEGFSNQICGFSNQICASNTCCGVYGRVILRCKAATS